MVWWCGSATLSLDGVCDERYCNIFDMEFQSLRLSVGGGVCIVFGAVTPPTTEPNLVTNWLCNATYRSVHSVFGV